MEDWQVYFALDTAVTEMALYPKQTSMRTDAWRVFTAMWFFITNNNEISRYSVLWVSDPQLPFAFANPAANKLALFHRSSSRGPTRKSR